MILILVLIVILGLIFLIFLGGFGMLTSWVLGDGKSAFETEKYYIECVARTVNEETEAYINALRAGEVDPVRPDEPTRLEALQKDCRVEAQRKMPQRDAPRR